MGNDDFNSEPPIEIDSTYSLTVAIEDFKLGVQFYQQQKLNAAYPLLRKSLLKFQNEHQHKLSMEATYLIATILVQMKKYHPAREYFTQLSIVARTLENTKYIELGSFMRGYCNYKLLNYTECIKIFEKISILSSKYINLLQYYSFLGRSYGKINNYSGAIENLKKAIEILEKSQESKDMDKQKAQILFDLGMQYHYLIIEKLKQKGFSQYENLLDLSEIFNHAVDNFKNSITIWEKLGEIQPTIATLQILGNIYGYLKEPAKQIEFYQIALKNAKILNDFTQEINIVHKLAQVLEIQKEYTKLTTLLQNTIEDLSNHAYDDILTMASLHKQLGIHLIQLNRFEEATDELIIALNIFQKLPKPVNEHLITLQALISLFNKTANHQKASFYEEQYKKIKQYIEKEPILETNPLSMFKDLWIITTTGIEIFSYAPNADFDLTLFGGFISALQTLSQEISKENMESFVIGTHRYIFYYEMEIGLFILGRVNIFENEDHISKILREIYQQFYSIYKKEIKHFKGDVSPFQQFRETLQKMDFTLI